VLQKDDGLKARIYSILLCFLLVGTRQGIADTVSSAPYACFHWLNDLQIVRQPPEKDISSK
jgi:hypothetical protein